MKRFLVALVALVLSLSQAFATDCSGTTTASTKAVFNNSSVRGFFIMNNSANLMCLAFDGAAAMGGTNCAAGSYPLAAGTATVAGGSFTSPSNFNPTSVNIISTSGSDTYSCTRY